MIAKSRKSCLSIIAFKHSCKNYHIIFAVMLNSFGALESLVDNLTQNLLLSFYE